MLSTFRKIGWAEGGSFLVLLLVAMPLKYLYAMPLAVRIVGALHGGLFIAYLVVGHQLAESERWPLRKRLLALVAAVLPFGTFIFDHYHLRDPRPSGS